MLQHKGIHTQRILSSFSLSPFSLGTEIITVPVEPFASVLAVHTAPKVIFSVMFAVFAPNHRCHNSPCFNIIMYLSQCIAFNSLRLFFYKFFCLIVSSFKHSNYSYKISLFQSFQSAIWNTSHFHHPFLCRMNRNRPALLCANPCPKLRRIFLCLSRQCLFWHVCNPYTAPLPRHPRWGFHLSNLSWKVGRLLPCFFF